MRAQTIEVRFIVLDFLPTTSNSALDYPIKARLTAMCRGRVGGVLWAPSIVAYSSLLIV